ncbi:hypothetical protein PS1_024381 [Malus domestica]
MFATAPTQPLHHHRILATLHRRHCTAAVLPAWALPTRPQSAATKPSKSTSMKGLAKPFAVYSGVRDRVIKLELL